MVKKIIERYRDADTKILYKKSYNSIFTHSRTCSGTSHQTKTTYLPYSIYPRRKRSSHREYTDGLKIKKDLSIETDICILRRYYKYKRNWLSSKAATSAKSKYSNYTEIDTIAEFRDASASGDKLLGEDFGNLGSPTNMDWTDLMLDNFKDLLLHWIKKHLLEDTDTREKIEDVFEAVLQGVESRQARKSSSCTTYVLSKEDEIDRRNFQVLNVAASTDYNGQCCSSRYPEILSYENIKQSCYTVPIIYNNLRIISTLSIPRNINRRRRYSRRRKLRRTKVNRTPNKNLLVSYMRTPLKFLATVSSFNLLSIPTKSLIKRCVNFDNDRLKDLGKKKPQHLILFSEPSNKSATASAVSIEEVKYKDLKKLKLHFNDKHRLLMSKSLLNKISQRKPERTASKEMKCNNTDAVAVTSKNEYTDNFKDTQYAIYKANAEFPTIMNEREQSDPLFSIDLLNQSLEYQSDGKVRRFKCSDLSVPKNLSPRIQKHSLICKHMKKKCHEGSSYIIRKYEKKKHHNFTYLYKRVNSKTFERDKLVKNMEDIIKYISNLNGGGNIKFEVHLSLASGNKKEDVLSIDTSSEIVKVKTHTTDPKYSKPNDDKHKPTMVFTANQTPDAISKIYYAMEKPSPEIANKKNRNEIATYTEVKTEEKETPAIIPILDGAASQNKYIVSTHSIQKDINVMESNKEKVKSHDETTKEAKEDKKDLYYKHQQTSKHLAPFIDFDLKQEISELRAAVRNLASTTEKLLNEHYHAKASTVGATINSDIRMENKKHTSLNVKAHTHSSDSAELDTVESKKYSSKSSPSMENRSNSKKFSSGDATVDSLDDRIDSKEEENEVRIVQYITNASLIKDQTIKATQYSTKMPKYPKIESIIAISGNKHDKGLQNSSQKVAVDQSQEQKKKMTSVLKKHSASYRVIESESIIKVTNMTSNSSDLKQQMYYDKALTCSLPKSRSLFEFSMDFTNRDILAYFCDNIKTPLRSAFTHVTSALSPSRSQSEPRRANNVINIEEGHTSKTSNQGSDRGKCSGSTIFEETYSPEGSSHVKFRTMGTNEGVLLCTIIFVPLIVIIVLLYEFVLKDKGLESQGPGTPDPNLYIKLADLGF